MTTYVLGAGASHDAGYPLAKTMASELLQWMKRQPHDHNSYAGRYPGTARFFEERFSPVENVEDLITKIHQLIDGYENGTREERANRTLIANQYGVLKHAVRAWFAEIQRGAALDSSAYREFAENVVVKGDCIITFNYDVSLERELRRTRKFEVGDGYGFPIEGLPGKSATKVLKLHGSTNWLALLFGGLISGPSAFQPGHTLSRPAIPRNELSFLGYTEAADPAFGEGGPALPVMIFPSKSKNFYFAASTGTEYTRFWDDLWLQAAQALQSSSRIVICGYSLLPADERARERLLNDPKKDAEIEVASGDKDTQRIVRDYQEAGYAGAVAADEVFFKNWVASFASRLAVTR